MNDISRLSDSFATEIRGAALDTQDLVIVTQAIESRVSSLSLHTPLPAVRETVVLLKATAVQLSTMLFDLVARAERIAGCAREYGDRSSNGDGAVNDEA